MPNSTSGCSSYCSPITTGARRQAECLRSPLRFVRGSRVPHDVPGGHHNAMNIGFIGLGTMGARMATNLQKAGHQLVINDIRPDAGAQHLAAGAEWADTPHDVGAACHVVFTSLPGPPEVEAVGVGENGLIEGMQPG